MKHRDEFTISDIEPGDVIEFKLDHEHSAVVLEINCRCFDRFGPVPGTADEVVVEMDDSDDWGYLPGDRATIDLDRIFVLHKKA